MSSHPLRGLCTKSLAKLVLGRLDTFFRIWLLHSLLFFTAICIVAGARALYSVHSYFRPLHLWKVVLQEPKDEEEEETMAGRTAPVRFAALGLVAPCHALLVTVPLDSEAVNQMLHRVIQRRAMARCTTAKGRGSIPAAVPRGRPSLA